MIVDEVARNLRAMIAKRGIAPGLVALGLAGCGNDAPSHAAATGSLEVPLIASVNGHVYRLQAYLYVQSDPFGPLFFNSSFPSGDEAVLSITLPAGGYVSDLSSWSLEGQTANGDFRQVQAELISPSRIPFTVFAGSKATLTYRFSTEGFVVSTGSGGVDITFAVNERPGACVPFGEGCGAGTWCAPSELTGKPLACIEHGSVPLGAPCTNPTACVAGATCRVSVASPEQSRCIALCPLSELGKTCPSGETCTGSESGYGVCGNPLDCSGGGCAGPGPAGSGECHRTCVEDLVTNGACNGVFSPVGPDSDAVLGCVLGPLWPTDNRFPAGSCANGNLLGCYCGNLTIGQCLDALPADVTGPCKDQLLAGSGCSSRPVAEQSQCLGQVIVNPANATGRALAYVQCLQDNCPDICFSQQ